MSSNKFGWSYPAGAANDPNVPYNQEDIEDNSDFEEQFADYESLYALYRAVYKYTACGPSVGVTVYSGENVDDNGEAGPGGTGRPFGSQTFYCDDLRKLGTFADMRDNGLLITAIGVSSIVEGVDQEVPYIEIEWTPMDTEPAELAKQFWDAVEQVNREADDIWRETHGCEKCAELLGMDQWESGDTMVHEDCPECLGEGIVI